MDLGLVLQLLAAHRRHATMALLVFALVISVACGRPAPAPIVPAGPQDAFPEAPGAELAAHGIELSSPTASDHATVAQLTAEATAAGFSGHGTTIRRSLLVRLHYVPNSKFDCLCWAVSVVPPGDAAVPHRPAPSTDTTPSPDPQFTSSYYLIFVNARTGAIQITFERGRA